MISAEIILFPIIVGIGIASYKGFNDVLFFDRYKFEVQPIILHKQYHRIVTSGLLHADWIHLLFNAYVLYVFGLGVGEGIGIPDMALILLGSLVTGNLLALFVHREHPDYAAVGISGGVSGLVFAYIALYPGSELGLILIPGLEIPAWIFGLAYLLFSLRGIIGQMDNLGHEAHVGGSIFGFLFALAKYPELALEQWWQVVLLSLPILLICYIIFFRRDILIIGKKDDLLGSLKRGPNVSQEQEIDRVLDKINKSGIDSLTSKEKELLDKYSNRRN